MVMCPLGIIKKPVLSIIRANVQYMTRRAPKRSENQPPTGRSREAGKMKVAVSSAAVRNSMSKFST